MLLVQSCLQVSTFLGLFSAEFELSSQIYDTYTNTNSPRMRSVTKTV